MPSWEGINGFFLLLPMFSHLLHACVLMAVGHKVYEDVCNLFATILVLLALRHHLPEKFPVADDFKGGDDITSEWRSHTKLALLFVCKRLAVHGNVYRRLDLGASWKSSIEELLVKTQE